MGITKILIIALLVWTALKVYSVVKSRSNDSDDNRMNKKIIPCSFCKTHVPLSSAIRVNNKYFCSKDHSRNA